MLGRAEDMHAIMDTETGRHFGVPGRLSNDRGGRRGASSPCPDQRPGLVYATARHATTRAGDPGPHDHVLIANCDEMSDAERGLDKAPDTAAVREQLHAATMFGRVASAAKAVELGYAIEADDGPSGKLGHWSIAGMPEGACELYSKRSAEVTAAVDAQGHATYQARQVAARGTRRAKRHTPPADPMAGWLVELAAAGYSSEGLLRGVEPAAAGRGPGQASGAHRTPVVSPGLVPARPVRGLADQKVFTRADVAVAVGPLLFGLPPAS